MEKFRQLELSKRCEKLEMPLCIMDPEEDDDLMQAELDYEYHGLKTGNCCGGCKNPL